MRSLPTHYPPAPKSIRATSAPTITASTKPPAPDKPAASAPAHPSPDASPRPATGPLDTNLIGFLH